MRAHLMTRPGCFEVVDTLRPSPDGLAESEVLLRVLAGAICGSDLGPYRGHASPYYVTASSGVTGVPGFPLHEVVGEVVGSRTDALVVGQRVVGWATRWNGLSEFIVTQGDSLLPVDNELDDISATVIQPLACVLFSVARLEDVAGQRVAVIGQGPLGILFSHVLKDMGAAHVVGVDLVDRSEVAASFGVDEPLAMASRVWAANLPADRRPSIVIEAVGHQVGTVNDAIEAVAFGGEVFCFGVPDELTYPIEFERIFRKNLAVKAGAVPERSFWLAQAAEYLKHHPRLASDYVTNVFDAKDAQGAFDVANRPAVGRLKVALSYSAAV